MVNEPKFGVTNSYEIVDCPPYSVMSMENPFKCWKLIILIKLQHNICLIDIGVNVTKVEKIN